MMRRILLASVFCVTASGFTVQPPAAAQPAAPLPALAPPPALPLAPQGQDFATEIEANNAYTTATSLPSTDLVLLGNIYPATDVDYFSFSASAGDRLYAAVMTGFDASAGGDSVLTLYNTNGTTVLETDDNDGTLGASASSIAGTVLPATGTYFLRVSESGDNSTLRPYHLHVRVQSGSPTAEVEPNNIPGTAQPLPNSGWISGVLSATTDDDFYAIALQAGDTLFASLDLNPARAEVEWAGGRLGIGVFSSNILVVDDAGSSPPSSEAFFLTVKDAGTYYIFVDTNGAGAGAYHLSVSVHPPSDDGGNCATYTSTDVPKIIGPGPNVITSTLTIPDRFLIADLDVSLALTHTFMSDIDAVLVSPAGNTNGLFTDVGSAVSGQNTTMNIRLDDEAGFRIGLYVILAGMVLQPELAHRLSWFDGEQAFGQWSLVLHDDATGDGGQLQSWSLTACKPPDPPVCPAGSFETTVFSTDFEAGAAGFTHSGADDEWELGTPTFVPLDRCLSGSNCWATDLDNTYNANSNQTLSSPPISLAGYVHHAWITWAQRYQLESATFDNAYVEVQDGQANTQRLWEWLDATMNVQVGNPANTIQESAGWGIHTASLNDFLGQEIEFKFNLQSDTTVQLGGLAIDDVTVMACGTYPLFLPLIAK